MADIDLTGKVAIVTGGGRGMGREMALALAGAGAAVTITAARETDELDRTARDIEDRGGRVLALAMDVTEPDLCVRVVEETVDQLDGLDLLVNNAARGHKFIHDANPDLPMDFWNADIDGWKMLVDTNINGPFLMARAATPYFLDRGFGRIVNIGATENTMQKAGNAPYGVTKAALESETLIWAKDLEGTGKNVTCNSLSPGGATLTGMIYGDPGNRKLNDPAIMGPPIVWLASERSDWLNGRRLIAGNWDPALPPDDAARAALAGPALTPPAN